MSLQTILDLSSSKSNITKQGLSEERLKAQLGNLRTMIAFYRQYPDLLVDELSGYADAQRNGTLKSYKGFKFYTYQRIFLRVVMRHRYVYATFPRAYSKSFLSMMVLMLRCILYPGSHLFVTTGGKLY
jgi:hypothetical protein